MFLCKKLSAVLVSFLPFLGGYAQTSWQEILRSSNNFYEIQKKAQVYFKNKPSLQCEHANEKFADNEYVKYKRWEWYWHTRLNEDGTLADRSTLWSSYNSLRKNKTRAATWRNIGQTVSESGYHGMGRIISIAFHPTNVNTIYAGGEIGGLWKSINNGVSWTPIGDNLPYLAVGNIVVLPSNPNVMFVTIGKNSGWWHYGLGIYKTTDGGQTWTPTSHTSTFNDQKVYYKLAIDPSNENVMYSCESAGLFKTTNGGASWSKIHNGEHVDFEFMPGHSNTFYTAVYDYWGSSEVYKSTNAGGTYTQITNFNQQKNNIRIAVTKADSNFLAIGIDGEFDNTCYTSNNAGANVAYKSLIDNIDLFLVSPTNKDILYCGYVSNYCSVDGGSNWDQVTNWYDNGILPTVHADNQNAAIHPVTNTFYIGNDGGLYKYDEDINQWTDISNGLVVTQFYKIAVCAQDSVFMIGGTQDNGGRKRTASPNLWESTNGGDGMEVAINQDNDQTMYTTYWGGTLYRSYDRWVMDDAEITPDPNLKGAWVTPYMLYPKNQTSIVAAYADVYRSDDEGNNWYMIGNQVANGDDLEVLDVAPSNENVVYTGRSNDLYKTSNGGSNWSSISLASQITGLNTSLTTVKVHPSNENWVYVTSGGYAANKKVYFSNNGGQSWQNHSYNLPNTPVNNIIYNKYSDSANLHLYIATDMGVFFKAHKDTVWKYYGSGLPNTEVSDLEIFYPTAKLRAATYGRGVWETDLEPIQHPQDVIDVDNKHIQVWCNNVLQQQDILLQADSKEAAALQIEVMDLSGKKLQQIHCKLEVGMQQVRIPFAEQSAGTYLLKMSTKGFVKTQKIVKY